MTTRRTLPLTVPVLLAALIALVAALLWAPARAVAGLAQGGPGSFPITFRNDTRGAYTDAQVFITVLGQVTPASGRT